MSKSSYLSILFLVAIASVGFVSADDTPSEKPEMKALKKTLNGINDGAAKGAELVQGATKNIEVKVENFVSKPSGEGNIIGSAIRGVGRLLRNVTVEAGKFVGVIGKGAYEFAKNTRDATAYAVERSAKRAANMRGSKSQPNIRVDIIPSDEISTSQERADNELVNNEASNTVESSSSQETVADELVKKEPEATTTAATTS